MQKADKVLSVMFGLYLVFTFGTLIFSYKVYVLARDQQKVVSPIRQEPLKIQVEYKLPEVRK